MTTLKFITAGILLSICTLVSAWTYTAPKILGNYDGDTFRAELEVYPQLFKRTSLRVIGVDTPELVRSGCDSERELAKQAKAFTANALKGDVVIEVKGLDKYGRALAIVRVDGKRLDELLIAADLGVENHGQARKGWCN